MEKNNNEIDNLYYARKCLLKKLKTLSIITFFDTLLTITIYGISIACVVTTIKIPGSIPFIVSLFPIPIGVAKTIPFFKEYIPEIKMIKSEINSISNDINQIKKQKNNINNTKIEEGIFKKKDIDISIYNNYYNYNNELLETHFDLVRRRHL